MHLEHDPSQGPQVVVEAIWYSPSGHVDSQVFEVVSTPELHSVHSESEGPVHLEQSLWQSSQVLLPVSRYFPSAQEVTQVFDAVNVSPVTHSVQSLSFGPSQLKQDEWQLAQTLGLTPVFLNSLSGHVDSQVFEVVNTPESHSVQSLLFGPSQFKQDEWQLAQTLGLTPVFLNSLSGHVDWHLPEVVSSFSELPESHSVHSESEGPVHLEQDSSQSPQVVESIWYSPSGHVDSQVFEVVSTPELHSVHSESEGPVHSAQSLWQF